MSTAAVTEKLVKKKVKTIIELFGKYNAIYTLCPMTMGYGESGHPDRLLLINGVLVGIEVKRDKNNHHTRPELKPKASEAAQKRQAEKIKLAGGKWICVHNYNLRTLAELLSDISENKLDRFTLSERATIDRLAKG